MPRVKPKATISKGAKNPIPIYSVARKNCRWCRKLNTSHIAVEKVEKPPRKPVVRGRRAVGSIRERAHNAPTNPAKQPAVMLTTIVLKGQLWFHSLLILVSSIKRHSAPNPPHSITKNPIICCFAFCWPTCSLRCFLSKQTVSR